MATKYHYEMRETQGGCAIRAGHSGYILEYFSDREQGRAALAEYQAGVRVAPDRPEAWLVADYFIGEASVSGIQWGTTDELDLRHFDVVRHLTQDEFDAEVEAFFLEFGHYPDT